MTLPYSFRTPCSFLYPPNCFRHPRAFSESSFRWAERREGSQFITPRSSPLRSNTLAMKEEMERKMPEDNGLMIGTFVMPTGLRKPSLYRRPKERLRLEWHRLRVRCQDFFGLLYYKFMISKSGSRPKLGRWKIKSEAEKLYQEMYTAFAEGNTTKLSNICTEGLLASFSSRIAARPRNQRVQWTLHHNVRRPIIVVDRAAKLPFKESACRQAIIRMQTKQSLAKFKVGVSGNPDVLVPGTGEAKDVREYLVIQRRVLNGGNESPWKIWGTTDESDVQQIIQGKNVSLQ